ncbi:uncharacterized protein si:dkey-75a21.2 isoform X5 [Phycodurus eques]|uniref:uncharacterized protein si:dkey-75a21.2 isoform X5 n=1 Tax=Phycodurus eques TaxID=693459 RepID=UPI002ACDC0CD|nr:uncharacterized protein si:dkey-75a21.2 isoform X5 [Phycodurus eques]
MAVPQNEPTLSPYQQRIANLFNGNTFRRSCGKKRFTCTSLSRNISEFPALEDYLPKNYDYHVCDFDLIRETGDHVDFKTTFRMVLSSKEDIKLWMKSHAVTWRVDRTYVTKGQKVIFKVDYRCQRNTRPRRAVQVSGHSKNTDCPAMMCVKLFRTQVSRGRQSGFEPPRGVFRRGPDAQLAKGSQEGFGVFRLVVPHGGSPDRNGPAPKTGPAEAEGSPDTGLGNVADPSLDVWVEV